MTLHINNNITFDGAHCVQPLIEDRNQQRDLLPCLLQQQRQLLRRSIAAAVTAAVTVIVTGGVTAGVVDVGGVVGGTGIVVVVTVILISTRWSYRMRRTSTIASILHLPHQVDILPCHLPQLSSQRTYVQWNLPPKCRQESG